MARTIDPDASRAELDALRAGVDIGTVLERAGFRFDKAQSTRQHQKYRREGGNIVIVTHEGRGWWDPHSTARGDVFQLVQHLHPGMSLGHVRQELRPLIGISPTTPPVAPKASEAAVVSIPEQWDARRQLRDGSAVWSYLSAARALPSEILREAGTRDALREGIRGTAWFAHRDADGALTGAELRGPEYRGFTRGGDKALFQLRITDAPISRVVVAEASIDALSLAAMDNHRAGTLYTATTGGMGPHTVDALNRLMGRLAVVPGARVVAATDADQAGHAHAQRITALAESHGLSNGRVLPQGGLKDFNEVLQRRAEVAHAPSLTAESFVPGHAPVADRLLPDATHTPMRERLERFREARAAEAASAAPASSPSRPPTLAQSNAPATPVASQDPRP